MRAMQQRDEIRAQQILFSPISRVRIARYGGASMGVKIVKFKNGKFGVRKGLIKFNYKFSDFNEPGRWWYLETMVPRDNIQSGLDEAKKLYEAYTDYGCSVKEGVALW
jgi:hypothetical protein